MNNNSSQYYNNETKNILTGRNLTTSKLWAMTSYQTKTIMYFVIERMDELIQTRNYDILFAEFRKMFYQYSQLFHKISEIFPTLYTAVWLGPK